MIDRTYIISKWKVHKKNLHVSFLSHPISIPYSIFHTNVNISFHIRDTNSTFPIDNLLAATFLLAVTFFPSSISFLLFSFLIKAKYIKYLHLIYKFYKIFICSYVKNWLIEKDSDAGKDWRLEEKGTTEDEIVGWHHWLDGHEFEQAPGIGDGQGSLACCSHGVAELETTEWLNWTELIVHIYKLHLLLLY